MFDRRCFLAASNVFSRTRGLGNSLTLGALKSCRRKIGQWIVSRGNREHLPLLMESSFWFVRWVANPEETAFFVRMLLRDIHLSKLTPYLE